MSPDQAFEDVLARLRAGDDAAAAAVFDRFARRLIHLAQQQLDRGLRAKVDAEDVVQSVLRSFFRRCRDGQYELVCWDSLWGVLATITVRKCINRVEYFRAAGRDVRREVPLDDVPSAGFKAGAWLLDREPTPPEAAALTETIERLMAQLDERERTMLTLALEGQSVEEISRQVGRSERTVQRLLEWVKHQLLTWRDEEG